MNSSFFRVKTPIIHLVPKKKRHTLFVGAVGHNEISIIIPCHRVVGTNGSLTGYADGIRDGFGRRGRK